MIRLKDEFKGKEALFISGGVSILQNEYNLKDIDKDKYVIFIESKALTPKLIDLGVKPDFIFMSFPEKTKDNNLQHFIYRSFMAKRPIKPFLKPKFHDTYRDMKLNFDKLFDLWRPHRGPHKRYRWKPDVYMENSPYDLLQYFPKCKIITQEELLIKEFPNFKYSNQLYFFSIQKDLLNFDIEEYFHPIDSNGVVELCQNQFLNSSAISVYPLLSYMGFNKVFLLGMDMSNLGSMEFSAPYLFKSIWHFYLYLFLNKRSFNSNYIMNKPFYLRPQSEFEDLNVLFNYDKMKIIRIYDRYKYSVQIDTISSVSYKQFLQR